MRLDEIARLAKAELRMTRAQETPQITRVSSIGRASADALVFAEDAAAYNLACTSGAGAVIVPPQIADEAPQTLKPLLAAAHPKLAFALAARALQPSQAVTGVHSTALVGPDVSLGPQVSVAAYAVLGAGVRLGKGTSIGAGAVIGEGVQIGEGCRLYPRVVLYPGVTLGDRVVVHAGAVLGADGFGYVRDAASGEYLQFPQQGTLIIEDDVEIGANATIDRGALEETRIERGVKLDNLVHVGHNVQVGRNVVIAAQTGVSGSSSIGHDAVVGGQVGIADHVEIGDAVILGAQAGIPSQKKLSGPGVVFWGTPARPIREHLKELAVLARLARQSTKRKD